jgi:glycosyltransferase involved in cell wall biosynthesis
VIVSAILVCHDGERWLPTVLEGLSSQSRPIDRVVAVDTHSLDRSVELVGAAYGAENVVETTVGTSFPEAVDRGLAELAARGDAQHGGDPDEWVWLLHDDATPAPDALEQLRRRHAKLVLRVSVVVFIAILFALTIPLKQDVVNAKQRSPPKVMLKDNKQSVHNTWYHKAKCETTVEHRKKRPPAKQHCKRRQEQRNQQFHFSTHPIPSGDGVSCKSISKPRL